ncbi:hypothetical protein A2U01_0067731, partial [Trifolium medium]|nr:hypothetical protein [Trifolium medium]
MKKAMVATPLNS